MSHVHDALRRASEDPPRAWEDRAATLPLELNQFISVLVRRKFLFLAICFGFFLVCCAIILTIPKRYEAEMKFLVKNERQNLVISPDRNTSTMHSNELSETEINSEIELLRSKDVLRRVALKSGLSRPEPGTVQAAGEISPVSLDKALIGLEHDLAVSPVKKSDIIEITYTSKDPELASTVLKNLADNYLQAHLKIHGTPGSYAFFEQQANAYRDRLEASEEKLKAFQEKYSSLVQPDQDQALTTHSMDSQAALEQVDAQIADYNHRISQNQQILAALDPRVVTQMRTVPQAQLIGNLNQTLIELRNKRTELVSKFRSDDRMVLEVDKQIADTTAALQDALKQISTEKQTDANPVRQDAEKNLVTSQVALSGLKARRAALAGVVGSYENKMLSLASATIQHDQLLRQVKENEDNYLLYEKKREEARIAESLDQQRITNVAVVQAPVTPVLPSGPKVKLDILLSAICSVFLAFTAVLSVEFLSSKPDAHQGLRSSAAAG
jgi:uncharacterized protein involved in exopolysaccharide biosynthesis